MISYKPPPTNGLELLLSNFNRQICDQDNCNDWLPGSNSSLSTPMPVPPTTPASHHTCYYGIKENGSLSLDNTQICRDDQNLCVRITTEDEEDDWEMRSCWDDDFNMEFSRPGCYKVRRRRPKDCY